MESVVSPTGDAVSNMTSLNNEAQMAASAPVVVSGGGGGGGISPQGKPGGTGGDNDGSIGSSPGA